MAFRLIPLIASLGGKELEAGKVRFRYQMPKTQDPSEMDIEHKGETRRFARLSDAECGKVDP